MNSKERLEKLARRLAAVNPDSADWKDQGFRRTLIAEAQDAVDAVDFAAFGTIYTDKEKY